jgi:hypothetical protein
MARSLQQEEIGPSEQPPTYNGGSGEDLPWRRAVAEAEQGKAELDLLKCKRLLHNILN